MARLTTDPSFESAEIPVSLFAASLDAELDMHRVDAEHGFAVWTVVAFNREIRRSMLADFT
jgi:hypothetical protein